MDNSCILSISDFRLWVHLGVTDEEKFHHQCVSFKISITFSRDLKAISSDNLDDAFCYVKSTELLKEIVRKKRYNLIEHLAGDVYKTLKTSLDESGFVDSSLSVTVTKLSPPLRDIHGGVSFTYNG